MNDRISIPSYTFSTPFKSFTMTISSNSISTSLPLYLHQCQTIEHQETTTDPTQISTSHPETIYFYNSTINRSVSKLEANREEVPAIPQNPDNKTIYFVKEESES